MTPAQIKAEIVWEVKRDIEHMQKAFFGSGGRSKRRERRAKQPWLKRLKTGG